MGRKKWQRQVGRVVKELRQVLEAEEVVLGGGNAKKLKKLPPRTILGGNRNAFLGGFRMWSKAPEAFRQNRNAKRT